MWKATLVLALAGALAVRVAGQSTASAAYQWDLPPRVAAPRVPEVLEEQALVPMLGDTPIELGMAGHEPRIHAEIGRDPSYQRLFPAAFLGVAAPITTTNIAAALSAFERSIVSFRSPFDRYRQYEETSALSESAARGMVLFFSNRKAGCISCHRGLNLDGGSKDVSSPPDDSTGGRTPNPARSTGLKPFTLSDGERRDLIAFLQSLTDEAALRDPRWSNPWK